MKTFRTRKGPFTERPYYRLQDIETICADELRAASLYPKDPSPIRIDRFIEKRFRITPEYGDVPAGVLGYTRFGPKGVEKIVVDRSLSEKESKVADRRINTTLAHEGGHGLLHTHLFEFGKKPKSLFDDSEEDEPQILCRNIDGHSGLAKPSYSGKWWEYQANLAMGALLLPALLVEKALEPYLEVEGSFGIKTLKNTKRKAAVVSLSGCFDVNPIVVAIRLDELFPEGSQLRL